MAISPLAGQPAPAELRIDPDRLRGAYHDTQPDVDDADHLAAIVAEAQGIVTRTLSGGPS